MTTFEEKRKPESTGYPIHESPDDTNADSKEPDSEMVFGNNKILPKAESDAIRATVMDLMNQVVSDVSNHAEHFERENTQNYDVYQAPSIKPVPYFSRRESEPIVQIPKLRNHEFPNKQSKTANSGFAENDVFEPDGFRRLYQLATSAIQKNLKKKPKISDFVSSLQGKGGIWLSDPRLKETFRRVEKEAEGENAELTEEVFMR